MLQSLFDPEKQIPLPPHFVDRERTTRSNLKSLWNITAIHLHKLINSSIETRTRMGSNETYCKLEEAVVVLVMAEKQ
jgi:hypothetical protein